MTELSSACSPSANSPGWPICPPWTSRPWPGSAASGASGAASRSSSTIASRIRREAEELRTITTLATTTLTVFPNTAATGPVAQNSPDASTATLRRGVVVDGRLASVTDDRIHAIGDCAEHRGVTTGFVPPAWDQAGVLAGALCGAVGQTVAARLQTPTLYLIANDLTKMQIDSNVAEADVGDDGLLEQKAAQHHRPGRAAVARAQERRRGQHRGNHGLDPARPIIALLPGSRQKEIHYHLPVMLDAARRLRTLGLRIANFEFWIEGNNNGSSFDRLLRH